MARNSRNKRNKTQVIFDEKERKDYLTGFRKRKEERRRKAREELERQIKDEKKRQKEIRLDAIKAEREKAGLPSIDEIVEKNTRKIELAEHTITISDMDSLVKPKLFDSNDDDDDDEEDEENSSESNDEAQDDMDDKTRQKRVTKKTALAKISPKLTEKLIKLEQRKKLLEPAKPKKKKINKRCIKSTKKFNAKDSKFKKKKDIKKQKYLNKKGLA